MGSELLTIAIGNNLSTTCSTLTVIYLGFDQLNCPTAIILLDSVWPGVGVKMLPKCCRNNIFKLAQKSTILFGSFSKHILPRTLKTSHNLVTLLALLEKYHDRRVSVETIMLNAFTGRSLQQSQWHYIGKLFCWCLASPFCIAKGAKSMSLTKDHFSAQKERFTLSYD